MCHHVYIAEPAALKSFILQKGVRSELDAVSDSAGSDTAALNGTRSCWGAGLRQLSLAQQLHVWYWHDRGCCLLVVVMVVGVGTALQHGSWRVNPTCVYYRWWVIQGTAQVSVVLMLAGCSVTRCAYCLFTWWAGVGSWYTCTHTSKTQPCLLPLHARYHSTTCCCWKMSEVPS